MMSHEKLWENFVYNIRIIGIINRVSDPVSGGTTKTAILNIEQAEQN